MGLKGAGLNCSFTEPAYTAGVAGVLLAEQGLY